MPSNKTTAEIRPLTLHLPPTTTNISNTHSRDYSTVKQVALEFSKASFQGSLL